jgi:hypothetical protein
MKYVRSKTIRLEYDNTADTLAVSSYCSSDIMSELPTSSIPSCPRWFEPRYLFTLQRNFSRFW